MTRLPVCTAEDDAQLWPVAISFEHSLVNLLCRCELMLLEIRKSQGIGNVIIIRRNFQDNLQLGRRLVEVTEHEKALAEHMMGADVLRVDA